MTIPSNVSQPENQPLPEPGNLYPPTPAPLATPTPAPTSPLETYTAAAREVEAALFEVKRTIVGQHHLIESVFIALLAGGHCLLEGVPGVAKTLTATTVATTVGGSFARIQFTPDLVPSDIVGTRIYRPSREGFDVELGPVFANVVLADEINRAPAKVQAALLEVMAEGQVSIGGVSYPVPQPFVVLATQNPIESEGVFSLPEAQRDRFLLKVFVDYPTAHEELGIIQRAGRQAVAADKPQQVLTPERLHALRQATDAVFVHDAVADYAVRMVMATRNPSGYGLPDLEGKLAYGAGPRASLGLVAAGQALALMRGRGYLLPEDVQAVAREVLAHRLVLSFDAIADGVDPSWIVWRIVGSTPLPQLSPQQVEQYAWTTR